MILEPIKPEVLAVRVIPNVDAQIKERLKLAAHHRSIGMITCTSDDALYASLDEGTKAAAADVVYAKSFYAGAAHASGPFSGEIIGIYAAEDEETVSSALQACLAYLQDKAWFFAADDAGKLAFFPHVLPHLGRYLSAAAGVEPGTPMAYLIAPPIEAVLGLDAALKAASVEMKVFYAPPSETNFAGGLLVGELHEVEVAARAFQETVLDLARRPHVISPSASVEEIAKSFGKPSAAKGAGPGLPFRMHASGMELADKPADCTHLFDNRSLVPKTHPAIRFRGKLDLLQGYVLDAAVAARGEGHAAVAAALDEILQYLRNVLAAEVTGRPMPELSVAGFSADELQRISHNTGRYLNVGWVMPQAHMGATVSRLNLLRGYCREVELAAMEAHGSGSHVAAAEAERMLHGLNRLSSAVYVLVCRAVSNIR
jgi:ethanolamine utilization protein EutL